MHRLMIEKAKCLVILDTQWGYTGQADPWFAISEINHSGKRIYRLTGLKFLQVWVTNACSIQVDAPHKKGKPDPHWLDKNLSQLLQHERLTQLPLLVMGTTAQETYEKVSYCHKGEVLYFYHPAARNWTIGKLQEAKKEIQECLGIIYK